MAGKKRHRQNRNRQQTFIAAGFVIFVTMLQKLIFWLALFGLWGVAGMGSAAGQRAINLEIYGTVTNQQGEPLPGATIFLHELNTGVTTNEAGHFRIQKLQPGRYHLHVTFIGYAPAGADVLLSRQNRQIDFSLKPSTLELSEVFVEANPFRTGPLEQSLSIETISRDFLEKYSTGTFAGTLEKLPGITAIKTGVGIAKPVVRGLSFNRVIVNDRGIKQEGQQWGADHGLEIDQFEPERVEIIKGPGSLLYGSDGMGGIINIRPAPLLQNGEMKGSVLGIYKQNNHLLGTSVMAEGNRNDFVFRLRGSLQDFGDYRIPAESFTYNGFALPVYEQRLKNTAGQELNLTAMAGLKKEWGFATLTFSSFNQEAGLFPGAMGIPRTYQLRHDGDYRNTDLPRQETQHNKVILNTSINLGNNDWVEADLGYQQNWRQERSLPHAHGRGPEPEGTKALGLRLHTWSGNVKYHTQHFTGLNAIYGVQAQWQRNERSGFEFLLPDFTSASLGAYSYYEWSLRPDFTLSGGLRFDYGRRQIDEYEEAVWQDTETIIGYRKRTFNIDRDFQNLSGALGLSWYTSEKFNAKLNLGSSFRIPTAPELSANGVHHGTFRHEMGDSLLVTERGYQLDLGFSWKSEDWLLSLSPFFNYFNDFIYLSPTTQFSNLPEGGQLFRYRQNNAVFTGGELSADVHLLRHLHLAAGAEYVWNYNLDTRLPLPLTPPFSAFVEVEYSWQNLWKALEELSVGARAAQFAAQNRIDRGEFVTPGYFLADLQVQANWKFGQQPLTLRLAVQNLTGTRYMNHLSRYRLLNLPEQGRNFTASVQIPLVVSQKKR